MLSVAFVLSAVVATILGAATARAAGDVFVFYSDGISETEDAAGRDFGQERIAEAARAAAAGSAAAVVAAVHAAADAFRGHAARGDDSSVIAVRVPAAADPLR